jgi:hypothetical protein
MLVCVDVKFRQRASPPWCCLLLPRCLETFQLLILLGINFLNAFEVLSEMLACKGRVSEIRSVTHLDGLDLQIKCSFLINRDQ